MMNRDILHQVNLYSLSKGKKVTYFAIKRHHEVLQCQKCQKDLETAFILVIHIGVINRAGSYCNVCASKLKNHPIDKYRENVFIKLNIKSRVALAIYAVRNNLA